MKRIRPATVTLGVCALVFGLVSAYAVRRYLEPSAPVKPRGVAVVVPRVNLPKYARIREQDVEIVELPAGSAPEGALQTTSRALFRLARNSIMAGEPIRDADLYDVGAAPTLAEQLPPGMRAVTISVADNQALGGMLLPESLIDISLTVKSEHAQLGGVATLTLLRGVKVLATSGNRFKGEERVDSNLRSVTVAVDPLQANKLILAQRHGTLSVTLRGELEGELASADGNTDLVNAQNLLGLPPVKPSRTVVAEIWRGGSVEQLTFHADRIQESRSATVAAERGAPAFAPASFQAPAASDGASYQPATPASTTAPRFHDIPGAAIASDVGSTLP